jgi:hypothetical protein
MRQCPACRTTYTDETLRFCLQDGGLLVEIVAEDETVLRPGVRVDIPSANYPTASATAASPKGNPIIKIVIAVLVVGFLGLLGLGAAGAMLYFNSGGTGIAVASPTPSAVPARTPSPSPTPEAGDERLEQEIANLQKQLEDALNPSPTKTPPGFESDDLPTARVNSPSDGFLALRSEPDSEKGTRLAQIPHGTVITLENCEKEQVKIGSRTGRWCMVTYLGKTGWVFDAWLEY